MIWLYLFAVLGVAWVIFIWLVWLDVEFEVVIAGVLFVLTVLFLIAGTLFVGYTLMRSG